MLSVPNPLSLKHCQKKYCVHPPCSICPHLQSFLLFSWKMERSMTTTFNISRVILNKQNITTKKVQSNDSLLSTITSNGLRFMIATTRKKKCGLRCQNGVIDFTSMKRKAHADSMPW